MAAVIDVYINGFVLFLMAAFLVLFLVFSISYRAGVDNTKRKFLLDARNPPPPCPADHVKTLPTPDGLDAELMTFVTPGRRIELRVACCKVKDCGAVLLTPHEYSPEATTETQYATDQGWHKAAVPPSRSVYWYCPNHMKAVRELLTMEEA